MKRSSPVVDEPDRQENPGESFRNSLRIVFNVIIGILLVAVGYFSAAFIPLHHDSRPRDSSAVRANGKILQCDVLNGCGAKGVSARVTTYLRSKGFDVVEMKNYKTFGIPHTIVVDRVGDLSAARRIAAALGVSTANVIQQLNPDYFVNVSVIIGADYSTLNINP
jgi:hypothetical protein